MADQTSTRVVRIVIDASGAKSGGADVEKALKSIEDRASAAMSAFGKATLAFGAIAGAIAVVKSFAETIAAAGTEVRNLTAQLNYATGAIDGSKRAFDAVVGIAQRTGAGLTEVGGAFQRIALGARDIGATTDQMARVTETFIKLGRIGGASMEEVNGALVQFGQSMASGRVQGDEFRSLMERVPAVMRAIANQLGVNTGKLREMAAEGQLTAEKAFGSLQRASADADREFAKLPVTMEQAGQRSATAWKLLGAALDDATGISGFLARSLDATAERVSVLAKRISGDLTQALRDVNAEIARLDARAAQRAKAVEGLTPKPDEYGVTPALPGGTFARGLPGSQRGAGTDAARAEAARLEQLALSQSASSQAELGMWERDREAREAAVRAAEAQAEALRKLNTEVLKIVGSYDKNVSAAEKVKEAEKTLNQAVAAGTYTRQQADEILRKYRAQLDGSAAAGESAAKKEETARKAAQKALDDYLTGLKNEASASALSDRERAATLAGLKAEELARAKVLAKTEDQIKAAGDEAREYARINYDRDEANKRAEAAAKRESELMMEPFKNALRGIQQGFTDLFVNVFSGGVNTFKDLAQAGKAIFVRMFAELASLQVMRFLGLDRLLAGAGAGGLPGTAGAAGAVGAPGIGGGFNPTQWLSGIPGLGFLNQPIQGQVGVQNQWISGTPGFETLPPGGGGGPLSFLGNTTWGQGLAGLGFGAAGAYQLATGGGSMGSLIGGIGGLAAGAMSFIPGLQAFAPIVGIASGLLGSLFGGGKPKNPQATTDILIQGGRAVVGGNTSAGAGNIAGTNRAGQSIADELNRTLYGVGLRFGSGAQGGYILNSVGQQTGDQWIYGTGSYAGGTATEVASGLTGETAVANLLGTIIQRAAADGKLVETGRLAVSDTMMKVLAHAGEFDEGEIERRIQFAKAYDDALLGQGAGANVTRSIRGLREEFNALAFEAERLGIAVAPLDAELNERIAKMGADFMQGLSDRLLQQDDPLAYQRAINLRGYNEGVETATSLFENGALSLDDFNQSMADLLKLLNAANDNAAGAVYGNAFNSISAVVKSISFGALGLATPQQNLAGLRGEYEDTLRRAQGGDLTALQSIGGAASAYVDASNRFYGGTGLAVTNRQGVANDLVGLGSMTSVQAFGEAFGEKLRPLEQLVVELIEQGKQGVANGAETVVAINNLNDAWRTGVLPTSTTTQLAA